MLLLYWIVYKSFPRQQGQKSDNFDNIWDNWSRVFGRSSKCFDIICFKSYGSRSGLSKSFPLQEWLESQGIPTI